VTNWSATKERLPHASLLTVEFKPHPLRAVIHRVLKNDKSTAHIHVLPPRGEIL
jgi:hypothetical protein